MELRLLGPIEASLDGKPVPLGAKKQRALLAMLALNANTTVSTDRLVDGLWGDDPPASAPKMVQLYVSQLRRVLGDGDEIATRGRGYELRIEPDHVDAARFERLVRDGAAREALALWRGDPLSEVSDEPFAPHEIRRLEELRLHAIELAIDAELEAGRSDELVGELDKLVAEHPLRERLHAQRMLALYRSGRQADALEAYRTARGNLVEEIGAEPGAELRSLHEAILKQDPELDLPARKRPRPARREQPEATTPAQPEPRGSRRRLALVAALVAVAGLAVALVSLIGGDESLAGIDENAVGLIDPDDVGIHSQFAVGQGPGAVAAGGGSVWVANVQDGTVSRIDRKRSQVTTIDVGGEPTGLAFGSGSLWVSDGVGRSVVQVNAKTNRVVQRVAIGNQPRAVAAGFGAVWVATGADGEVVRLDVARGRVTERIQVGGAPSAVATGAGGVWVASEEGGAVLRIDPNTNAVVAAVNVGNGPGAVAFGEGAVWVANRPDGTVSRIDPATNAVTETVRVGHDPRAVAVGRGAAWVANGDDGSVSRIAAGDRRVSATVPVRSGPAGIAVADGSVWVSAGPSLASHRGGTLRLNLEGGVLDPLDPGGYGLDDLQRASLVHDGLVAYRRLGGSAGTTLVGALATQVPKPSDDGRTYVFTLRPGVRYSNGRPVRPEDFRWSMERSFRVSNDVAQSFYGGIVGAKTCVTPSRCDLSKGIETDARAGTVTVHLTRPEPDFLPRLALPFAFVVPSGTPMRPASRPIPGTGPYRFAHWDDKRGGLLVRNPVFRSWSQDARPAGFVDRIEYRPKQREPDWRRVAPVGAGAPAPRSELEALKTRYAGRIHSAPLTQTDYMFLNSRRPPFDDVRMRRALNYATDRGRVADLFGGEDLGPPTCQILPPGVPGYRPICPYTLGASPAGTWTAPDVRRAQQLIARSPRRGAKVTVWASDDSRDLADYFESLLDDLGFRASARVLPGEQYFEAVTNPKNAPQIGVTNWFADYPAPSNFLPLLFGCHGGVNVSRFCDSGFERRVARAAATSGPEAGVRWQAADRYLVDQAAAIPLVNRRQVVLVSDRVGNVQDHPVWSTLLDRMWVR